MNLLGKSSPPHFHFCLITENFSPTDSVCLLFSQARKKKDLFELPGNKISVWPGEGDSPVVLSNRRINKTKGCGSEKLVFYCRITSPGRGKLRLLLYQGIIIIVGIQMKLEVNKNFEHLQRDSPICHLYTLFASARILCDLSF